MNSHPSPEPAIYERLMNELREQLLATSGARSRESGDDRPHTRPPLSMSDGDGASSRKDLPTSVASVDMCYCGKHPDVHLHVTLLCTCTRPSTTDASTQTHEDNVARDPKGSCHAGASVFRPLHEINEVVVSDVRSAQLTASVANGTSMTSLCQTVSKNRTGPSGEPFRTEERAPRNEPNLHRDSPSRFYDTEGPESSWQARSKARRRMVEDTMALVQDTLFEVLRDTPPALANTSTAGIFDTVFPVRTPSQHSSPSLTPNSISPARAQPDADARPVTPAALEPIKEQAEENPEPQLDARRYLVGDELSNIYEHVESRWAEICSQLRADVNRRYIQLLADCRRCLESEGREAERAQLLQEMAEARRELMTEIKEEIRTKCTEFTAWRTDYLERALVNSCQAMHDNDRPSVLAAVLRYEILDSLPDFEQRTRASAAALWKELVEQSGADVDAFFNELS